MPFDSDTWKTEGFDLEMITKKKKKKKKKKKRGSKENTQLSSIVGHIWKSHVYNVQDIISRCNVTFGDIVEPKRNMAVTVGRVSLFQHQFSRFNHSPTTFTSIQLPGLGSLPQHLWCCSLWFTNYKLWLAKSRMQSPTTLDRFDCMKIPFTFFLFLFIFFPFASRLVHNQFSKNPSLVFSAIKEAEFPPI